LKMDRYMLRGVWQALNCLSIHATYCVIITGASPGETKMWAAVRENGNFLHLLPDGEKILKAPRRSHAQPLLRELHWLPIQYRIKYKVTVSTFKSHSSATAPTYLSHHISEWTLRSSAVPLLDRLCETSLLLFCTNCLELIA